MWMWMWMRRPNGRQGDGEGIGQTVSRSVGRVEGGAADELWWPIAKLMEFGYSSSERSRWSRGIGPELGVGLGIGTGIGIGHGRLERMLAEKIQLLVRDSVKIELNFAQMQFIENCCHLFSR